MTATERLQLIATLLDEAFDPEAMDYDVQGVNQAHRVAAGGKPPRDTLTEINRTSMTKKEVDALIESTEKGIRNLERALTEVRNVTGLIDLDTKSKRDRLRRIVQALRQLSTLQEELNNDTKL